MFKRSFSDDPAMMAMMGSMMGNSMGGRRASAPYDPGPGGMGSGMRDIGLAQLYQANPRAAELASARLEAEAAVNAMGPMAGRGSGMLLGGALGGLAGAGLMAQGEAPGMLAGGALGALAGGALGGEATRNWEIERRRAKAYQAALARLGASRPEA